MAAPGAQFLCRPRGPGPPVLRPVMIAICCLAALPGLAETRLTVPGTSNPWLAAMPDGTTSRGDTAPDHAPVLAGAVEPGAAYSFSVTGAVTHTGAAGGPGPDGASPISHAPGAIFGKSGLRAPINALLGVFLGETQRDMPAETLDYGPAATRDQPETIPELGQVFFIGDGRTSDGSAQSFIAPKGATRLYLGTMDGWGWYNNAGQFDVIMQVQPFR